ncbi:hypothetical protein BSKO_04294 [Bryopsis sp. KO-2023]|nr:hypothetical protein BSKO_04294 [Bryopsis sp. KO-2023]
MLLLQRMISGRKMGGFFFLRSLLCSETWSRALCSSSSSNEVKLLLNQFVDVAHALPVKGSNVEILRTPKDFFDTMMKGIGRARTRLTIASLYIGTGGGCSSQIMNALGEAANDWKNRPDLKLTVLLDGSRGTRRSLDRDGLPTSSAEQLGKAMLNTDNAESRTRISLYQTPALQGLLKKVLPPRVREVVSVCHLKVYLFDDDVILTGANLSNNYFTIRQDRYMVLKESKAVADKLDALVQTMSDFSLGLGRSGYLLNPPANVHPIKQPLKFRDQLWKKITALFYPANSALFNWWIPARPAVGGRKPDTNSLDIGADDADTWVIPVVQFAHFHIRQDEICTLRCLGAAEPGGRIQLASAYLNLASPFQRALVRSPNVNLEILTASPQANGFFGAKGISGFFPTAYSLVMAQLWKKLCSRKNLHFHPSIERQILEYHRDKWQFHAKGIWYTPPNETHPILTAVGSPNFGHRSVYRDIEAQAIMVTSNPELRKKLYHEVHDLTKECVPVQEEKLVELQRNTGSTLKLALKLVRGFL